MQKKGGGSLPDYKLDFPLKKVNSTSEREKNTIYPWLNRFNFQRLFFSFFFILLFLLEETSDNYTWLNYHIFS